jgi:hypothetical protein
MSKFSIGDRVQDPDSRRIGTVVHVYREEEIRNELVAVRFDDHDVPLAVHVDDVRKLKPGRGGP